MKRIFVGLALALAAVAVQAQTIRWDVHTYAGQRVPGTLRHTTQTNCDQAIRAMNGEFHCHRVTIGSAPPPTPVPVVCPAAPAPTTQTIDCPAGTTGSQSRVTTYTVGPPDACLQSSTPGPITGTCTPVVTTPPPTGNGQTFYLSDCQAGAATGCVAGNDANPGTQASPKRTLAAINFNSLPAGSRVFMNRGGVWLHTTLTLENPNSSQAAPITVAPYGEGAKPVWRVNGANGINVGGRWANTTNDGGYVFRDIVFEGNRTPGTWGLWFVQNVRDVVLDGVEVTGFGIGLHASEPAVENITVRNSKIHRNISMGQLGSFRNSLFEGNTYEANNDSGSAGNHAIYMSNFVNTVVRNNTFLNNSVVSGTCLGGNVTFHGVIDGLLIEGNRIIVPAAQMTCYGFAVTTGYDTPERFTNVIIRGNTISGIGYAAIAANSAPGLIVEANRILRAGVGAIAIPANGGSRAPDALDGPVTARDNRRG